MKSWMMTLLLLVALTGSVFAQTDEPMDLNAAGVEQLAELDGIGEAKAQAIVAYRENHGPFKHIDELVKVSGIGLATLERNRDRIRVEVTASASAP